MSEDHDSDVGTARSVDPERSAFDPPHHPPLRDRETNLRVIRHIDETAQDQMAGADRPRYRAAQSRRSRMIAATTDVLRKAARCRAAPRPEGMKMFVRRWRGWRGTAAILATALVDVGFAWCQRARLRVGRESLGHPGLLP